MVFNEIVTSNTRLLTFEEPPGDWIKDEEQNFDASSSYRSSDVRRKERRGRVMGASSVHATGRMDGLKPTVGGDSERPAAKASQLFSSGAISTLQQTLVLLRTIVNSSKKDLSTTPLLETSIDSTYKQLGKLGCSQSSGEELSEFLYSINQLLLTLSCSELLEAKTRTNL
jgi:hypothetical protein